MNVHIGGCHGETAGPGLFSAICAVVLAVLLIIALISRFINPHIHNHQTTNEMTKEYIVKGMNCPHCQKSVQNAIAAVAGVQSVSVNLSSGVATVEGNPDDEAIFAAVSAAGFDPERP